MVNLPLLTKRCGRPEDARFEQSLAAGSIGYLRFLGILGLGTIGLLGGALGRLLGPLLGRLFGALAEFRLGMNLGLPLA